MELQEITELAGRLKRLYTAAVYDILDEMNLPNQCLNLEIKPLDRTTVIAGPAYTVAAGPEMRPRDELPSHPKLDDFGVFTHMYPGAVVVVAAAGESQSGIWGELMSNASRARGATGIVIDGGIRDGRLLREIEDWAVFCRYLSPIESLLRSRIRDVEVPIAMSGSLSSQVRVDPGDWIFGDVDGVIVIPKDVLLEVVAKAEENEHIESLTRAEVRAGVPVSEVYKKYGRL